VGAVSVEQGPTQRKQRHHAPQTRLIRAEPPLPVEHTRERGSGQLHSPILSGRLGRARPGQGIQAT
jgi:hypothetical protein